MNRSPPSRLAIDCQHWLLIVGLSAIGTPPEVILSRNPIDKTIASTRYVSFDVAPLAIVVGPGGTGLHCRQRVDDDTDQSVLEIDRSARIFQILEVSYDLIQGDLSKEGHRSVPARHMEEPHGKRIQHDHSEGEHGKQ
jgi:hypothetical protein